jgi:hypothetical protein
MTQDDVIEMAREAGFEIDCCSLDWHKRITAFANLVAAKEREACAVLCDAEQEGEGLWYGCALYLAEKIRARGEQHG